MKIMRNDLYFSQEHINKKENINQIIGSIFSIAKKDESFNNKENIDILDKELNEIKEKLFKQEELIIKAKSIREDYSQKTSQLDLENFNSKVNLLEALDKGL